MKTMALLGLLLSLTAANEIVSNVASAALAADQPAADSAITVIPAPAKLERLKESDFVVTARTAIVTPAGEAQILQIGTELAQQWTAQAGFAVTARQSRLPLALRRQAIVLTTAEADPELGDEGYELTVSAKEVTLRAPKPAGLFYGVQTLRQLARESTGTDGTKTLTLPAVHIWDKPAFTWRGMLLDCSRHFMMKDIVKRQIDILAYHKMNRLQLHLTDNDGWRLPSEKYPRLNQVGSWRNEPGYEGDLKYGGFYSREEIKEIVDYAARHYVMIVPEVEMPAHSFAALAAYPQYSCTGGPFELDQRKGGFDNVLCPGNEETFQFLYGVLDEVIGLFPGSPYIHIGGDECPKDHWQKCPKCQARIKQEGLKDEHELQSYFIKRIEQHIVERGRTLIGWDEIIEGGLAPRAVVMSWRCPPYTAMDGAAVAAQAGHDTINAPTSHCYIDYPVAATPLEKVYSFNPVPAGLTPEQARHILGSQVNLWSEQVTMEKIDLMAMPRLCALAEVVWSPAPTRSWPDFQRRMQSHTERLLHLGVHMGPGLTQ